MTDEPTLGEVIRRLDEYVSQQQRILDRLEHMATDNAATYVRQDVYIAQRQADQAIVADLHGDIQTVKADRQKDADSQRQRNFTMAILAVSTLVSIALGIAGILAR